MPEEMTKDEVPEKARSMSNTWLSGIKNGLPAMTLEMGLEIKMQLMMMEANAKRLVAGACVVCSNAEDSRIKSYTRKTVKPSEVLREWAKPMPGLIVKPEGGIITQKQLELCHKDIEFSPYFEKCKVCGECKPEIENNEWQGYDPHYVVGDGYGLNKDEAYMICVNGGGCLYPSEDGQLNCMREYGIWLKENPLESMTISEDYINFLIQYEAGDTWMYAQDLGDGVITVAFGVVIEDNGTYPLGKLTYDYYMNRAKRKEPITYQEAYELTQTHLKQYTNAVKEKAEKEGWDLTQNRFDALVDMAWNMGFGSLKYKASELLATGDLSDESIKKQLEKEILETAKFKENGVDVWSKGLAERRLDIVRIAEGGEDAYTKNEWTPQWWNQNAHDFLIGKGIPEKVVDQYQIQIVKKY